MTLQLFCYGGEGVEKNKNYIELKFTYVLYKIAEKCWNSLPVMCSDRIKTELNFLNNYKTSNKTSTYINK